MDDYFRLGLDQLDREAEEARIDDLRANAAEEWDKEVLAEAMAYMTVSPLSKLSGEQLFKRGFVIGSCHAREITNEDFLESGRLKTWEDSWDEFVLAVNEKMTAKNLAFYGDPEESNEPYYYDGRY
jgi:hypothetical protein